ncbi:MAG: hypothetical protein ABII90_11045 [Bacteroidota bacterium]
MLLYYTWNGIKEDILLHLMGDSSLRCALFGMTGLIVWRGQGCGAAFSAPHPGPFQPTMLVIPSSARNLPEHRKMLHFNLFFSIIRNSTGYYMLLIE